jgi:putative membrane protein insertion efficiency factor
MNAFGICLVWLIKIPILFYRRLISPLLPNSCRFTPSCSEYMLSAIDQWGVLKGGVLGLRRIAKCHPWGAHGYDPVPKKDDKAAPRP